ncbi:MAG: hypothetical protein ACI9EF_001819 [Pseudohongiellaceae bacterium]
MLRSSTSSSDPVSAPRTALPWAGIAAILLVLISDRWMTTEPRLWQQAVEAIDKSNSMELGVARDRMALAQGRDEGSNAPRVYVLGSSRAERGFSEDELAPVFGGRAQLIKLTHAGLRPYEVAALAGELAGDTTGVVVLTLSEFDTHRPLRLMAQTAAGSLAVWRDLVSLSDWRFLKANRETLLRLFLAGTLNSYRFREVAAATEGPLSARFMGAARHRAIETVGPVRGKLGSPDVRHSEASNSLADQARSANAAKSAAARDALVVRIGKTFPALSEAGRRAELTQLLSISRGEHALLQQALLRLAVQRLSAAGITVIVMELPLHPLAEQFFDTTLRDDSLAFFAELARAFDATIITKEMSGPFTKDDFADLTHLGNSGAEKLSRSLGRVVLDELSDRDDEASR